MVFNAAGELMLTRRSEKKRLWPGFWDGTVASHVLQGENYEQASVRRLAQEIGLITHTIKYLFKFHYKAGYKDIGTEHEICAVTMVNNADLGTILLNDEEISETRSICMQELIEGLETNRNEYTPWLILAVDHMNRLQGGGFKNRLTPFCSERTP